MTKGFKWTGFVQSTTSNAKSGNYHAIGWNVGEGDFKEWDVVNGKKVKCQLSNPKIKKCQRCGWYRETINAKPSKKQTNE